MGNTKIVWLVRWSTCNFATGFNTKYVNEVKVLRRNKRNDKMDDEKGGC